MNINALCLDWQRSQGVYCIQVVRQYGADALRLYLINSPVVRAEPLRFEERGVKEVVKAVFLPWYNAYRFLAQNVTRIVADGGKFVPVATLAAKSAQNVLDRWLQAATRTLINTVRQQMEAYRLYNVVPYLLKFIDGLTNIYVRYNRRRLKGRGAGGAGDADMALATLFDTLLKVRALRLSSLLTQLRLVSWGYCDLHTVPVPWLACVHAL